MGMNGRLACLWLILVLGPLTEAWSASSERPRPGVPAPVSKPWAVTLKKFAGSQVSRAYFNGPDIPALAKIDVGDPKERRLFSPWVASLRDMKCTRRKLESMDAGERERFMSVHVENAAVASVIAAVHQLRDKAADKKAGVSELSETAKAIERLRRTVEVHAPYKAGILADAYDKTQDRLQALP